MAAMRGVPERGTLFFQPNAELITEAVSVGMILCVGRDSRRWVVDSIDGGMVYLRPAPKHQHRSRLVTLSPRQHLFWDADTGLEVPSKFLGSNSLVRIDSQSAVYRVVARGGKGDKESVTLEPLNTDAIFHVKHKNMTLGVEAVCDNVEYLVTVRGKGRWIHQFDCEHTKSPW